MQEQQIDIPGPDGLIDTFICHPDEGGPHPAIVFYMDAPAIREELLDMARRLASVGYYVLLPNLYYRAARAGHYGFDHQRIRVDETERSKMFAHMHALSNAMLVRDTSALLAHLRADPAAAKGPVGCVGYCMSGQFVVAVGAAYPDDFAAIASYYGVGIVTDQPDSPHLSLARVKGELYLAFAQTDMFVPDAVVAQLPGLIEQAGANGRVETYPGTEHGFAFPQRTSYVKAAGERHWERMLALFARNLPRP
jgi:carboxymethylenebutenolidase